MRDLDKHNRKLDQHDDHLKAKDYTFAFGNLDASSTSDGAGPGNNLYVGSGNSAANFSIFTNHDDDIELGLKVKVRQGADILPDQDGVFIAPDGTQPGNPGRAAWNFDFSVNTGVEGGAKTLEAFDFRIVITSGDGERAVLNMVHLGPGNTPWMLAGSSTPVGFADEDGSNPQVSQNSVNLGFGFLRAIFGEDYADAGETYTIELQAFDGLRLVGAVSTVVDLF